MVGGDGYEGQKVVAKEFLEWGSSAEFEPIKTVTGIFLHLCI
jgi:hypothetical protein